MKRRRALWVAALFLAALIGAQIAYWHWAVGLLETGLQAWTAQQRILGWTMTAGPPARGGWPLRASVTVSGVQLSGRAPSVPDGFTWQAGRVVLLVNLLRPGVLHVQPEGAQRLHFGTGQDVPFTADRLRLGFPLQAGRSPWTELDIAALRAVLPPLGPNPATTVTLGTLSLRGELTQEALAGSVATVLTARASAVGVPDWLLPGLGPRIEAVSVVATLTGPLPPLLSPRQAAIAWRDGGGKLEFSQTQLHWGQLEIAASASLGLDAQLQPTGAATLRMTGHAAALDALAAAGLLPARTAAGAKAMLGLVARPSGPDGAPEVNLPLTLQRRTLAVRQFPLLQVPAVPWPAN